MVVSTGFQVYETRPIQCWGKMKELRRQHFRHTWTAHESGDLVIIGVVESFLGVLAGMGDFANPTYGPYFTRILREPQEALKYVEEVEKRGYSRDICSSMRLHMGQMFMGLVTRNPLGGTTIPDFVFQFNFCQEVAKMGQLMSEHLGIPFYLLDVPFTDTPENRAYLVANLQDSIEWMEKTAGRKFDDGAMIEATRHEWEVMRLWAQICELVRHVPAPVDGRHLWSLRLPTVTLRHRSETVVFYRELLDEIRDRVQQGISARGIERARILLEGGPPFIVPVQRHVMRYPEEYGAVIIGGGGFYLTFSAWEVAGDGTWSPIGTMDEHGLELRTREDALKAQVELYLGHRTLVRNFDIPPRAIQAVSRTRDWKADGVIYHINRGCYGGMGGLPSERLAVQRAGFPTTMFEASHTDPRDADLVQITERYDSFLESLGLKKLSIERKSGEEEIAE